MRLRLTVSVLGAALAVAAWETSAQQTPQALEQHLKAEIAKWAPIIKKAGTYAD